MAKKSVCQQSLKVKTIIIMQNMFMSKCADLYVMLMFSVFMSLCQTFMNEFLI